MRLTGAAAAGSAPEDAVDGDLVAVLAWLCRDEAKRWPVMRFPALLWRAARGRKTGALAVLLLQAADEALKDDALRGPDLAFLFDTASGAVDAAVLRACVRRGASFDAGSVAACARLHEVSDCAAALRCLAFDCGVPNVDCVDANWLVAHLDDGDDDLFDALHSKDSAGPATACECIRRYKLSLLVRLLAASPDLVNAAAADGDAPLHILLGGAFDMAYQARCVAVLSAATVPLAVGVKGKAGKTGLELAHASLLPALHAARNKHALFRKQEGRRKEKAKKRDRAAALDVAAAPAAVYAPPAPALVDAAPPAPAPKPKSVHDALASLVAEATDRIKLRGLAADDDEPTGHNDDDDGPADDAEPLADADGPAVDAPRLVVDEAPPPPQGASPQASPSASADDDDVPLLADALDFDGCIWDVDFTEGVLKWSVLPLFFAATYALRVKVNLRTG
ncbi:hypothetical protein M885DRAFT_511482 [Pelagophyceae sp. CCMP2097]|nr:hypothetical protein M885DRAFT_511482 [Pelagophyceae sp. CCMP2097]